MTDEARNRHREEDQFRKLGVNNEDKMTYFLLKWVFNAIKRDSPEDDAKLKGSSYVTKSDLSKQLSKNDELMRALGFKDQKDLQTNVKFVHSAKEGCFMWEEFLDFFFLKNQQSQQQKGLYQAQENWWREIGKEKPVEEKETERVDTQMSENPSPQKEKKSAYMSVPRYGRSDQ